MGHTVSVLNQDALFCDETPDYRIPMEPGPGEKVTLRFRTARDNATQVYLIYAQNTEIKMYKAFSLGLFDYYEASLTVGEEPVFYYFEVTSGSDMICYDKQGCTKQARDAYLFRITPGFSTPDWAKGAVFYQIFVDRFCNGSLDNDPLTGEYAYIGGGIEKVEDWSALPEPFDVRRFYGGDLQGVRQKLDYLQSLGVEVIYFNPLFVSPSNHKYDVQDYDYIDPHFAVIKKDEGELLPDGGMDNSKAERYICRTAAKENLEASNEYFAELVEEIHSRGMRVILDGVFNHCGSFNKWLDRERVYENHPGYVKGAYIAKDSPYHSYFSFHGNKWPYNGSYDGWWGHDTLPKLNYEEESGRLKRHIMEIGRKWVSPPYNVDGWRLDVAADLGHSVEFNHQFWKEFRENVKQARPDALILAEHYGDASSWLQGDEWDTVMNYDAFMEPITWFLTGLEKHSDEFNWGLYGNGDWFFRTMGHNMAKFQISSLHTAMNELPNHDHSRFMTRTNHTVGRVSGMGHEAAGRNVNKGIMKEAVVIQMTWPGAPTIYYGDEIGMVGWTDPDNRRTFPWGKEDWELVEFHRDMIRLRKHISCLRHGSYRQLQSGAHLIVYGRFNLENQAVVVVNNSREERDLSIPVWTVGIRDGEITRVMQTWKEGYNVGRLKWNVEGGRLQVKIPAVCAMVFAAGRWEE